MTVELAILISIGILTIAYAIVGIDYDLKWLIKEWRKRK